MGLPPLPLTPLVGREQESTAIRQSLIRDGVRICTLTGPGGIGKTRLAIQAATDCLPDFPGGVAYVSLAPLNDPDLVLPTVASVLGLVGPGFEPIAERIHSALHGRRMLIVLDNFEHVTAATRSLYELLQHAPELTLLVTSRSPLHISGEYEFAVPPLVSIQDSPYPPLTNTRSPAVALFEMRARAVARDFVVDSSNLTTITEICERLGGVPLAIELAAARSKILPPQTLLDRLSSALDILTGGPVDQPERHQTMRAAIQWSYDALSTRQRMLFCQLAVCAGGCSLEAAAAIAGVEIGDVVLLDELTALVDASLLIQEPEGDGTPRFQILEVIRSFGLEQLRTSEMAIETIERFATWCGELANRAGTAFAGKGPGRWADVLASEIDNFRSALRLLAEYQMHLHLLELTIALTPLWSALGHQREGLQWFDTALARVPAERAPALTAQGQNIAARLATRTGDFSKATTLALNAQTLARSLEDGHEFAHSESVLGNIARGLGNQAEARVHYQQALELYRETNDLYNTGYVLVQLAKLGDFGNPLHSGSPEELVAAHRLVSEALEIYRTMENQWGFARALLQSGYLSYKQARFDDAANASAQSLTLFAETGNLSEGSQCIENLADIAGAIHAYEMAATLYGIAENLQERLGTPMWPIYRTEYDMEVERVRTALSTDAFQTAWKHGRSLSDEQAIATALEAATTLAKTAPADPTTRSSAESSNLTQREIEVLILLATGASNRVIADTLFISVPTIKGHVQNMMRKLDLPSRTALAAYAVQHGFTSSS